MLSDIRWKLQRPTELYQKNELIEANKSVIKWVDNRTYMLNPKTLLERMINFTTPSTSVWDKEWDICAVLDGCRVDTFEAEFEGENSDIRSVASTSQTWIPRTFNKKDTSDVAYITANPFAGQLDSRDFAYLHLEPVTETEYGIETVPPKKLSDRVIHVWRRREKMGIEKLIIHFMQPHVPFRSAPSLFDEFLGTSTWGSKVWQRIDSDEINREDFLRAYRDNLRWVLDEGVNPIQQNCNAKIGITADHGNAAGEYGYYGHPQYAPISEIRVVPWAEIDAEDKNIKKPDVNEEQQKIDLSKQLSALGYK